ncbi:hypothetical protein LCM4579_03230 [Ensifer sp. LCM 4579]|nr:hypothetical protein LCM4579_03230 [Ensifer sp. LCM 4579]
MEAYGRGPAPRRLAEYGDGAGDAARRIHYSRPDSAIVLTAAALAGHTRLHASACDRGARVHIS